MKTRTAIGTSLYLFGVILIIMGALIHSFNPDLGILIFILGLIFMVVGPIIRGLIDSIIKWIAFVIVYVLLLLIFYLPLWIVSFVLINVYKLELIGNIFEIISYVVLVIISLYSIYFFIKNLYSDQEFGLSDIHLPKYRKIKYYDKYGRKVGYSKERIDED